MQGKTINGYTLQRQLGIGGMAEVWYAENAIGKQAAVKLLLLKYCHDDVILARFQNEARVMVKLNHPNIRQVYDYGYLDGRPCILMEYMEGDDLKTLMKGGRRFTDDELRKWWNQIADALIYTHSQGIVHRDMKPSNIFLDKQGNIKLLDYGIAKIKESISMTQTGAMMGTLMYMSPEQVRDSKSIGPESDSYSLAVTFVHLITGKRPYDTDTSNDYEIRKGIVEIPLDLADLPFDWRNFLEPYLAKDPENRPPLRHFEDVDEDMVTRLIDDTSDPMGSPMGAPQSPMAGDPMQPPMTTSPKTRPYAPKVIEAISKLPKRNLIIAIVAVVVLGVVAALVLSKKPPVDENHELDIMRVAHKKAVDDFVKMNNKINSENTMTNKDYVTSPLEKLQEIERIENNPKFPQLGINRDFSTRLKEYREKLIQLSNSIQNSLDKLREEWKETPGSSFEDDTYVKSLNEMKSLIHTIMDLTKNGSVKDIDVNNL